jgi:hypothetical protein
MCTTTLKSKHCIHVHNDVSEHVVLHDVMKHALYNDIKKGLKTVTNSRIYATLYMEQSDAVQDT